MSEPVIVRGRVEISDPDRRGTKNIRFLEALQNAVDLAIPPTRGDIQNYKVVDVSIEYGGIAFVTTTQVTIEVQDGPIEN